MEQVKCREHQFIDATARFLELKSKGVQPNPQNQALSEMNLSTIFAAARRTCFVDMERYYRGIEEGSRGRRTDAGPGVRTAKSPREMITETAAQDRWHKAA